MISLVAFIYKSHLFADSFLFQIYSSGGGRSESQWKNTAPSAVFNMVHHPERYSRRLIRWYCETIVPKISQEIPPNPIRPYIQSYCLREFRTSPISSLPPPPLVPNFTSPQNDRTAKLPWLWTYSALSFRSHSPTPFDQILFRLSTCHTILWCSSCNAKTNILLQNAETTQTIPQKKTERIVNQSTSGGIRNRTFRVNFQSKWGQFPKYNTPEEWNVE